MIKSLRLRWAGYVAREREKVGVHSEFCQKESVRRFWRQIGGQ
jgi:hypothetical protein